LDPKRAVSELRDAERSVRLHYTRHRVTPKVHRNVVYKSRLPDLTKGNAIAVDAGYMDKAV